MSGSRSEICYICQRPGAESDDHVVPQSWFQKPFARPLLLLPAHHRCHGGHMSNCENYVRNLCALFACAGSVGEQIWNGPIAREYRRNAKLRNSLRGSLSEGRRRARAPGIAIEAQRFYPPLEKILKGLHCYHVGRLIPQNAQYNWTIINCAREEHFEILNLSTPGWTYPSVFESRYFFSFASASSVWWLRLFQQLSLRCYVRAAVP
jgi:hypothetical protein